MYETYYNYLIAQSLLGFVCFLVMIFVAAGVISSIHRVRKTKMYRKELSDLYVAAKIRQIAEADNISISDEYDSFKKWDKKRDISYKDLDDVIEEDLKEKASNKIELKNKEGKNKEGKK